MTIPHEGGSTGILVLRDDDHDDVLVLDRLRSDPSIEFVVNRPGMSGDSSSWKGWGHVRWFIEEVPAGAA